MVFSSCPDKNGLKGSRWVAGGSGCGGRAFQKGQFPSTLCLLLVSQFRGRRAPEGRNSPAKQSRLLGGDGRIPPPHRSM